MDRRTVLGAIGLGVGLSGCLRLTDGSRASGNGTDEAGTTPPGTDPGGTATARTTDVTTSDASTTTRQPADGPPWTFVAEVPIATSPTVHDGEVFVGTDARRVYALDAETGTESWSRSFNNRLGRLAIDDGDLHVHTERELFEFDVTSKELRTRYDLSLPRTVVGDTVYGGRSGQLVALERGTGEPLWESEVGTGYGTARGPTVAGGTLLFSAVADYVEDEPEGYRTKDARVFGVDVATGEKLWHFDNDAMRKYDGIGLSLHALDSGVGIVTISDGRVLGLSLDDGTKLWEQSFERSGSGNTGFAVYELGDSVAVCSGSVYSFDVASGELNWRAGSGLYTMYDTPRVVSGVGYVYGRERIVGVDAAGEVAYSRELPKRPDRLTVPSVTADSLFVAYDDATIGALER